MKPVMACMMVLLVIRTSPKHQAPWMLRFHTASRGILVSSCWLLFSLFLCLIVSWAVRPISGPESRVRGRPSATVIQFAVIRAMVTNADGRVESLVTTSEKTQEDLTRHVYRLTGLILAKRPILSATVTVLRY